MKVTLDEFFNYRPTVTYPKPKPMPHDDDTCADQELYAVSVNFNVDEEDILI